MEVICLDVDFACQNLGILRRGAGRRQYNAQCCGFAKSSAGPEGQFRLERRSAFRVAYTGDLDATLTNVVRYRSIGKKAMCVLTARLIMHVDATIIHRV